jgi:hypothetical protein
MGIIPASVFNKLFRVSFTIDFVSSNIFFQIPEIYGAKVDYKEAKILADLASIFQDLACIYSGCFKTSEAIA